MEKKGNMFLDSAKELKKTSALAVCAMLAALALILNSVASINIGPYVKIGFSGIPNQLMDYLFGPDFRLPVCRCAGSGKVLHEAGRAILLRLHIQCNAGSVHLWLLLLSPQADPSGVCLQQSCSHSDRKCAAEYIMA